MTRDEYFIKYYNVIQELNYYVKSMRAIARDNHVGLSTVQRMKKKFYKKLKQKSINKFDVFLFLKDVKWLVLKKLKITNKKIELKARQFFWCARRDSNP